MNVSVTNLKLFNFFFFLLLLLLRWIKGCRKCWGRLVRKARNVDHVYQLWHAPLLKGYSTSTVSKCDSWSIRSILGNIKTSGTSPSSLVFFFFFTFKNLHCVLFSRFILLLVLVAFRLLGLVKMFICQAKCHRYLLCPNIHSSGKSINKSNTSSEDGRHQ